MRRKVSEVERIAERFALILRHWLNNDQWNEMVRRNTYDEAYQDGACASHDFCDANMAMAEAIHQITGREVDIDSDNDLWNIAWDIARYESIGDESWRER